MKIKPEIKEEIKRIIHEKLQSKQQEVTIVAPYRLSSDELQEIFKQLPQLEGKKIVTVVDPSLIAGIIIKQGTKVLDLSIAERVRNLQHLVNEVA
jgi:F0F1-type ATP synthase delta subunit